MCCNNLQFPWQNNGTRCYMVWYGMVCIDTQGKGTYLKHFTACMKVDSHVMSRNGYKMPAVLNII